MAWLPDRAVEKTLAGAEHLRGQGKGSWAAEEDPRVGFFHRQEAEADADAASSPSLAVLGTAVCRPVEGRAFSAGGCGTLISGLAVCASVAVAVFCFQLTQSGGKPGFVL